MILQIAPHNAIREFTYLDPVRSFERRILTKTSNLALS